MKWLARWLRVFASMTFLPAKKQLFRALKGRGKILAYLLGSMAATLVVSTAFTSVRAAGTMPVPTVTIYPGDGISAQLLRERRFSDRFMALGGYFHDNHKLVGKVARRTLVRGKPIPLSSVRAPFAVRNGQLVTLLYQSGALSIVAKAVSLKSAAAGEYIATRNVDTGRTVSGMVQPDGSILVLRK